MNATKSQIREASLEGGLDETNEPTTADLITVAEISNREDAREAARKPQRKLTRIERLREIIESRSLGKVEGMIVDLTSAHIAVSLYNAVKPETRAKLDAIPIRRMIACCLKIYRVA